MSRAENCDPFLHNCRKRCRRRGYANGLADAAEKSAAMTPMQVLLVRLDPIIGAYAESGSPCGDPHGIEWWTTTYRLSSVVNEPEVSWTNAIREEMERLGWFLA